MKLFIAVVLFALAATALASPITEETHNLFSAWKFKHSKVYTAAEHGRRLEIFNDNLKYVKRHNEEAQKGKHSYTVGMNHLADLTVSEYRERYLSFRKSNSTKKAASVFNPQVSDVSLPTSVDWRTKGIVTPVKDQGQCGSCWSFSSTGSMEGVHALQTGNLVSLSEQNLVDCVKDGSYTCTTGGEMQDAFQYVIDNGGIESEQEYPYCACSGNQCQYDASQSVATISSFKVVTQGSEAALQVAAASNPVSIAIDASQQSFQLYSGGVYNEPACSSTELDHGVLIVGYGVSGGADYWLVKNSWSDAWGLQGYIMMSRNKNNQCGVATDASFPVA